MNCRVDFYLLKSPHHDALHSTLCRLVEKAYGQQHQIFIYCKNEKEAQEIDNLLWTYRDISFLPHGIIQSAHDNPKTPISISSSLEPNKDFNDILLNLTNTVPTFFRQFQRVIEIIPNSTDIKIQARENYRLYREQGCELHSHQLT